MAVNEDKPWFIKKSIQQAQWMNMVNAAWIPHDVKDLCRYVASKATWEHTKKPENSYTPCYATHDTIEIQMNRSTDYVAKAKKKALELGWIQVRHRAGTSDQIWPVIGEDDPDIKQRKRRESWGREDLVPLEEEG
jgi:hypothetical protein